MIEKEEELTNEIKLRLPEQVIDKRIVESVHKGEDVDQVLKELMHSGFKTDLSVALERIETNSLVILLESAGRVKMI